MFEMADLCVDIFWQTRLILPEAVLLYLMIGPIWICHYNTRGYDFVVSQLLPKQNHFMIKKKKKKKLHTQHSQSDFLETVSVDQPTAGLLGARFKTFICKR